MIICYYIRALSDIHSSIAQSVEHAAVNRRVVGSSPTGGAKLRLAASHDGKPLFPNIVRTVTGL